MSDNNVTLNRTIRFLPPWSRLWVYGAMLWCTCSALAGPPVIVGVQPPPSDWFVDGSALGTIIIEFGTDVIVPNGAISARLVGGTPVDSLEVTPLAQPTRFVTATFTPVRDNRVTLIVDYTITDVAGDPLDGEVDDPLNPLLPTGDGAPGGQAVFQFTVLQGEVNRDGVVDSVDLTLLNAAVNNYTPEADLNHDGVVNQADQTLLLSNAGAAIPKTDKKAPEVMAVAPSTVPLLTGSLIVTFSEALNPATLSPRSIHLIGDNGEMLSGSAAPIRINDARYEFPFANVVCAQNYLVKFSRAITDISGELLAATPPRILAGSDTTPPVLRCPDPVFVNSTDPFSVALDEITTNAAIQSFLHGAVAADDCTASADIDMFTSLDEPSESLPLGVHVVEFSAVDAAGNMATCRGSLIVVPAVPLEGPPGASGSPGLSGSDGADGADGQDGADGPSGRPGLACWDLNGNGIGDDHEDTNLDGVVNVLDCRGLPGDPGEPGPPGQDGADGSDGSVGDPPAGSPTGSRGRVCGAVGMIPSMVLLLGLSLMRRARCSTLPA